MVETYRTTQTDKTKGKWCHFCKHDFTSHGLDWFYWEDINNINFDVLKDIVVDVLQKVRFVFFDDLEYQYVSKFGRLSEFSVYFHHIL